MNVIASRNDRKLNAGIQKSTLKEVLVIQGKHLAALRVMQLEHKKLGENLNLNELKSAYKKRALRVHPDKPGGSSAAFNQLTEAFTFLEEELTHGGASSLEELFEELFTCVFRIQQMLNELRQFLHYFNRFDEEINAKLNEQTRDALFKRMSERLDSAFLDLSSKLRNINTLLDEIHTQLDEVYTHLEETHTQFEEIHTKLNEQNHNIEFLSGCALAVLGLFSASIAYLLYDKTPQKTPLLHYLNEALFYSNAIPAVGFTSMGTALIAHSIFNPPKDKVKACDELKVPVLPENSLALHPLI